MIRGVLLAMALSQAAAPGEGVVEGRVLTEEQGALRPVPHAVVTAEARDPEVRAGPWRITADADGRFRFEGLADGVYRLRARHPGYVDADIEAVLTGGRSLTIDLVVDVDPVPLDPVVVNADRNREVPEPPERDPAADLRGEAGAEVTLRAIEVGSGMAASGMTGVFQTLPGNDPADPTDALFMRGSAMDLKVVLLDGAPLYTPFHVSGLLPAFDPALLEDANLYNGGAPAEFEGGLSHVLDLRTRAARGDRIRFRGSADLLSARVGLEMPLGESAGLTFGGRALHGGVERILDRTGFPYGYADGMTRVDVRPGEGHVLSLTAFRNEESVSLDFRETLSAEDLAAARHAEAVPSRSSWGNGALSLGYRGEFGSAFLRTRAAVSRYDAELPVRGATPTFASGTTDRVRFALDFGQSGLSDTNARWAAGFTLDAVDVGYQATWVLSTGDGFVSDVRSDASGSVAAGFIEGGLQMRPRVRLQGGVRLASYGDRGTRIGPRAGVTWLLTDDAALSVRAGRTHQLTTHSDPVIETALGFGDSIAGSPSTEALPVAGVVAVAASTHVVVGLDQLLSPRTRLGIDGWARRFEGIELEGIRALNGSGFDLRIAREGESVDGWFGYSLTWYWSDDVSTASPFSGRHLLSAGLLGEIGQDGRFNVQLALGDGLPFTAIRVADAAAPENDLGQRPEPDYERQLDAAVEQARGHPALTGGPSGDFLRLDGEISWRWTARWGGRDVDIRPYVRILNALNRRDALFYYFEPWREPSPRPLAELSVVPVAGVSWRF